jgi:hypothetical protein
MHHKRKGPKSTRAGCLLCKPHKRQGAPRADRQKHSVLKAMGSARSPMGDPNSQCESIHAPVLEYEISIY